MSSKSNNTYATSMSVWGMVITVLVTIAGMVIGAVIGYSSRPFIGDDIPDGILCGILGLVIGLFVGGLVSLLLKFMGETGSNIAKVAENTRATGGGGTAPAKDPADLLKYKQLLDAGVITREEFERMKLTYMYTDSPSLQQLEQELTLLRTQVEIKKKP